MASLKFRNITKSFGCLEVVKGIDLDIADGEFCVFVGPSGCGKSTILRMIAGLEEITSGDLLIDGTIVNHISPDKRGLAMVFQTYALYPHMTVRDNLGFALRLAGVSKGERDGKVEKVADLLELRQYLDRKPRALSGGQRQRVAIGRAIVREPKVFLFDEPLSNLDAALRVQMRTELARLHDRLGTTMIYVTHDQVEAMTLADKIVVVNDGRIEQMGSPLELYRHPANKFVAGFIGSPKMNFIKVFATDSGSNGLTVTMPGGRQLAVPVDARSVNAQDPLTLGVRPEHLMIGRDGSLQGEVIVVERLGGETFVHVQVSPEIVLVAKTGGDSPIRVHDRVSVEPEASTSHVFTAEGTTLRSLEECPLAAATRAG